MAIYHMTTKPISRSRGRSATAAAAYRAGERIHDERTGETHDYTRRAGVDKSGCSLVLPAGLTMSREALWNAAEAVEKRKDARVAREWEIALPSELTDEERRTLAHDFAKAIVDRYGVAADVCIHHPPGDGDPRNCHAHILTTTRRIDDAGTLGEKSMIEREDRQLRAEGLPEGRRQVEAMRQEWERLANLALERAGHDVRIDHRSLETQGIERFPPAHLGPIVFRLEQRGVQTERGDINRRAELTTLERLEREQPQKGPERPLEGTETKKAGERVPESEAPPEGQIRAAMPPEKAGEQRAETTKEGLEQEIARMEQSIWKQLKEIRGLSNYHRKVSLDDAMTYIKNANDKKEAFDEVSKGISVAIEKSIDIDRNRGWER